MIHLTAENQTPPKDPPSGNQKHQRSSTENLKHQPDPPTGNQKHHPDPPLEPQSPLEPPNQEPEITTDPKIKTKIDNIVSKMADKEYQEYIKNLKEFMREMGGKRYIS